MQQTKGNQHSNILTDLFDRAIWSMVLNAIQCLRITYLVVFRVLRNLAALLAGYVNTFKPQLHALVGESSIYLTHAELIYT